MTPSGGSQALGARLLRGQRQDMNGARLPDDLVRAALGRARLLTRHEAVEVDRRQLAAEVEGDRLRVRRLDEGLRQQVLAVVLLDVVAAPVGVDVAFDAFGRQRPVEDVQDLAVLLDDRHDARLAERSGVPWLPAALGVERRPVEDDGRSAGVLESAKDRRLELEQVGIRQVESLGHRASLTGGSTAFNAAPAPRGRMWLTAAGSEPGPAR